MPAVLALFALVLAPGPQRSYEVYQPTIERYFVNDTNAQSLRYNHDSSIAWFGDRWYCLWNANEPAAEGRPGQLNYQSTSVDGKAWSPPVACFSDEAYAENPVPCPRGTQWQPNLIVVAGVLWAVWTQNSRDEHTGTYLSRLARPGGKWRNQRMVFEEGHQDALLDGRRFRIFATQNPYRLRSGRVLAPVTVISREAAADAPEGVTSWWAREKRDTVLYTDDGGQTWRCSPGAIQPGRSWAQWEPTVWELDDGTVMMLARNNDFRGREQDGPRPAEMLLWSRSTDGGETWTPHRYVPLETVASRMHVRPLGGDRYVMVHNDWPAGRFVADRLNLALFFKRGAGIEFVAGPGLTDDEPVVAYPQMWIHEGRMLISYSQGRTHRSIKVAHVTPLPRPDRYYLFPRSNLPRPPRPTRVGDALRFVGGQRLATRDPVDPGNDSFSAGAWVRLDSAGVLLDTRGTRPARGFVWGFFGRSPFVFVNSPERNLIADLELDGRGWHYVGMTVDNRTGTVDFFVDDRTAQVKFTAPAPQPLGGETGYVGYKRFEGSGLSGLRGDVRALAIYPAARFGAAEHHWLHNRFAAELGRPALEPAQAPTTAAAVWLDPADETAFERGFVLPEAGGESIRLAEVDRRSALVFTGEASAGVDLDENHRDRGDRVELTLAFRLDGPGPQVLCTVGDANEPARVVARDGQVWLEAGQARVSAGAAPVGSWTGMQLASGGDRTSLALDGGEPVTVRHRPVGTWLYLGQGYRAGQGSHDGRFAIDVASVRTRVITAE